MDSWLDPGLELYHNMMEGQQNIGFGDVDKTVFDVRLRILSWSRKEMKRERK